MALHARSRPLTALKTTAEASSPFEVVVVIVVDLEFLLDFDARQRLRQRRRPTSARCQLGPSVRPVQGGPFAANDQPPGPHQECGFPDGRGPPGDSPPATTPTKVWQQHLCSGTYCSRTFTGFVFPAVCAAAPAAAGPGEVRPEPPPASPSASRSRSGPPRKSWPGTSGCPRCCTPEPGPPRSPRGTPS